LLFVAKRRTNQKAGGTRSVLSATVVRSRVAGTNNYLLVDIISSLDMIFNIKIPVSLYHFYSIFISFT